MKDTVSFFMAISVFLLMEFKLLITVIVVAVIFSGGCEMKPVNAKTRGFMYGTCYQRVVKNSKHVFLSLIDGRETLKDLRKISKLEKLLVLEKNLLAIEKNNVVTLKGAKKNCSSALKDSALAVKAAVKLSRDLRKSLRKAWSDIITLKQDVVRLKRQRVTWFMVGVGAGAIVAGAVALAIVGAAKDDPQLRAGLIGTGSAGIAVGGTLIAIGVFR